MSRYVWLVCEDTKMMLGLGKIVTIEGTGDTYLHDGLEDASPNSENQVLMKALMKFLAQHIGKNICVIPEEDLDEVTDESFTEIGHEAVLGVLLSDYIKDFRG